MAGVLAGPTARLVAIIEGTLDVTALSTRAQLLRPAAGSFARAANHAQLRDPRYWESAQALFDRRYALKWTGSRDERSPENEQDPTGLVRATVELHIGYLHGPALVHVLKVRGSETQAAAALDPHLRALNDAEPLKRALCFLELYQTAPAPDPAIVLVQRRGETRLEELDPSHLVSVTTLEVLLEVSHASAYGR